MPAAQRSWLSSGIKDGWWWLLLTSHSDVRALIILMRELVETLGWSCLAGPLPCVLLLWWEVVWDAQPNRSWRCAMPVPGWGFCISQKPLKYRAGGAGRKKLALLRRFHMQLRSLYSQGKDTPPLSFVAQEVHQQIPQQAVPVFAVASVRIPQDITNWATFLSTSWL